MIRRSRIGRNERENEEEREEEREGERRKKDGRKQQRNGHLSFTSLLSRYSGSASYLCPLFELFPAVALHSTICCHLRCFLHSLTSLSDGLFSSLQSFHMMLCFYPYEVKPSHSPNETSGLESFQSKLAYATSAISSPFVLGCALASIRQY